MSLLSLNMPMVLLQLRVLMHTFELCDKINWKFKHKLETGQVVPSGCDVKFFTWKILMGLVLLSIGGQVYSKMQTRDVICNFQIFIGLANTCIFTLIQNSHKSFSARLVSSSSLTLMFFITCVNIIMTGIFATWKWMCLWFKYLKIKLCRDSKLRKGIHTFITIYSITKCVTTSVVNPGLIVMRLRPGRPVLAWNFSKVGPAWVFTAQGINEPSFTGTIGASPGSWIAILSVYRIQKGCTVELKILFHTRKNSVTLEN